jgi:bifunctional DNA-binding transcriptional regulator/antitoxin component of YhaV-PrlF toxin-antitoxin module
MDGTVRVGQHGTLTLPAALCRKYGIRPGDSIHIVDLDGLFVLTQLAPIVPELALAIEKARVEAGLSIDELLDGLRE